MALFAERTKELVLKMPLKWDHTLFMSINPVDQL